MTTLLDILDLCKRFGGLSAVNMLSFSVKPNEILGLIGPNGAGKTTVFNLVMGVHKPSKGHIRYKGRDITGWSTYRVVNQGIARVFQIAQPMHHKTVFENVEICTLPNAIFTRHKKHENGAACLKYCELAGLLPELNKLPGALPQAGLRRLEIAKAIATEADLLLLDEPFAGLTVHEVEQLSQLILDLREQGRTIVIVDHNMKGLMKLVDRVVVMNFGSRLADGTPADVISNPVVQEAYLAGGSL